MARKLRSKFDDEKLQLIDRQIEAQSIVYDYRTKDYPFEVIVNKFGQEDDPNATLYVPDYQREYVWENKSKSRFIESVLLGMPLTPFFVSEDKDNRLEIIDGSQRIRTLISFYNNEFSLINMKVLTELDTAKFKDLPDSHQRRLKLRDFRVIVVSDKADINIRKDIFNRINTSSLRLSDSEIRKGAFSGDFYDMILELKEDADFRTVCPLTDKTQKRGEYEELILRFFAYSEKYEEAKHKVKEFLDGYLEDKNEYLANFSETKIEEIKSEYVIKFRRMVKFVKDNFPIGFRKEEKHNYTPRVRFEAIAVGVHLALEENPELSSPDISWLTSDGFDKQTTSDTSNNPGRLKGRIEFVRDGLLGRLTEDRLNASVS